ncbi:SDR family oxidoreductase [Clostridium polynesiense]|uniref:SDR family oxidoreductase n=1 Tax=Clostridium polynesiense TaxID=1325933 RepID=UPI000694E0B6|nr:NAD(P)-dependent oxidoreductase [Clostridium polynesiense]
MNIIITGAHGNLGSYMADYFSRLNNVIALGRKNLNIVEKDNVFNTIKMMHPDLVIHNASINDMDQCEGDENLAYTVNTIGSLNIAYVCSHLNIPLVFLSSSYVFNGKKNKPYYETDFCDPINTFGKTKLAAEKLIRTICKKYFIIRTSWVFGGSMCYINKALNNKSKIIMSSSEILNPTYIKDLCSCIEVIIKTDFYGVYNCVNSNYATKKDVLQYAFEIAGIDKKVMDLPENYLDNSPPRPKYTPLNTSLINNCFNLSMPSWQERVEEYCRFSPHYKYINQ